MTAGNSSSIQLFYPQPPHQLPGIHAEAASDLQDVVEAEVALPTLDLSDVGPMQSCSFGQALLAETLRLPGGTNAVAKGPGYG